MRDLVRPLPLFLVGVALLALAVLAGGERLRLRFTGETAPARVAGLLLDRGASADLVTGVRVELRLHAADGTVWELAYADEQPLSVARRAPGATASETLPPDSFRLAAPGEPDSAALPAPFARLVREAVRGDATVLRWALRREERRATDPARILKVEKTELVSGFFDLPGRPAAADLGFAPDGTLRLAGRAPVADHARTATVFDRSDVGALATRRGESLASYARTRGDVESTPSRRDFFLSSEAYATVYRPVFTYAAGGTGRAQIAAVGRKGGPLPALPLFATTRVIHDHAALDHALLLANPGSPGHAPLEWFGRVCEGVFSLWGPVLILVIAAGWFLAAALLAYSLVLRPAKP